MEGEDSNSYTRIKGLVDSWLDIDINETTRAEIKELWDKENYNELDKRLSKRIEFGTAGLRSRMEAGFNRMNELTVLQASQGLAKYVEQTVSDAHERGIVIGHDHRYNSARFAEITGLAFSKLGFNVHKFGQVHTPMVPYGVDQLKASCGVMITASHNPALDNGYKVYWSNGCQIIPPHDEGISKTIEQNLQPWEGWNTDVGNRIEAETDEKIPAIKESYFEALKGHLGELKSNDADFKLVYTPMHGVGLPTFLKAMEYLGLKREQIVVVEEQAEPDPDFPTVLFPNPEEKGALDLAKQTADAHGINLILANDPDADRFAVAVKNSNEWTQLTGNQVGSLFGDYIVQQHKTSRESLEKLALLNSTVSSEFIKHLSHIEGFKWEDTLTGFKWIGNRAIDLEDEGYTVPFGYEEALGYMFGNVVHDKDGISAAYVFVQMALEWHKQGINGLRKMYELYDTVGYFAEVNSYYVSSDSAITDSVFGHIRKLNTPDLKNVGPYSVERWRDLTVGYDTSTPDNKPLLPVSSSVQMITVKLNTSHNNEGIVFTARGSGTEPKLKVYIEAHSTNEPRAQELARSVWNELKKEWFIPEQSGLKEI